MSRSIIDSETIKEIKRKAKSLKKERPELIHSQCLDIAAQEIAGTRNYYEANTRAKKYDFKIENLDNFGPGHHAPNTCPKCGSVDSLELVEEDTESMTEGQFAEYMAGTFGVSICAVCGHEVDWEI